MSDLTEKTMTDARVWRCNVTGNPVGTDTVMLGEPPCECQGCRAAAEITRLRSEAEAAEWQDISTAPRFGERILVVQPYLKDPVQITPADGDWWRHEGTIYTHWMTLPSPPGAIRSRPSTESTAAEVPEQWCCYHCGCRSYALLDERQADGRYAKGNDKRCVNCKTVFYGDLEPRPPIKTTDRDGGADA